MRHFVVGLVLLMVVGIAIDADAEADAAADNKRFIEAQFLNVKDVIKAGEDAHKDDSVIEVSSSHPTDAKLKYYI